LPLHDAAGSHVSLLHDAAGSHGSPLHYAAARFVSPLHDAAGSHVSLLHNAAVRFHQKIMDWLPAAWCSGESNSNSNNSANLKSTSKENLGYESGSKVCSFDEKNGGEKSHATVPLKAYYHQIFYLHNFSLNGTIWDPDSCLEWILLEKYFHEVISA
jgi:hypothetical protein